MVMRSRNERGQATLMVVVACGLFLIGALGLAIDGAQLYGHREMAQIAADGAAEAAALDVLSGTNTGTNAFGASSFDCGNTASEKRSPCLHARLNGFGEIGSTDTVHLDFPTTVSGVTLSPSVSPAAVHVKITRAVQGTLIRMLGAAATSSITAVATAAIVQVTNPVPILVLHPNLANALQMKGGGNGQTIQICGGPTLSIQVNSTDTSALLISGGPTVDLSHAGPPDPGDCSKGTGASLGVLGGPTSVSTTTGACGTFSGVCLGSTGHYLQPNGYILDPLKDVSAPSQPAVNGTMTSVMPGAGNDCTDSKNGCTIYTAGYYPNGIGVKNSTAIFQPGLYYMGGSGSGSFKNTAFGNDANGALTMCSAHCQSDATMSGCCDTGKGMMVYVASAAGAVNIGANSNATLVGADNSSSYKGILFFVDRAAPKQTHSFGGTSAISLIGTIYATNDISPNNSANTDLTTYQTIQLQGGAGSTTLIQGEIITDVLQMGGGGSIQMNLNPNYQLPISEVALVK